MYEKTQNCKRVFDMLDKSGYIKKVFVEQEIFDPDDRV